MARQTPEKLHSHSQQTQHTARQQTRSTLQTCRSSVINNDNLLAVSLTLLLRLSWAVSLPLLAVSCVTGGCCSQIYHVIKARALVVCSAWMPCTVLAGQEIRTTLPQNDWMLQHTYYLYATLATFAASNYRTKNSFKFKTQIVTGVILRRKARTNDTILTLSLIHI